MFKIIIIAFLFTTHINAQESSSKASKVQFKKDQFFVKIEMSGIDEVGYTEWDNQKGIMPNKFNTIWKSSHAKISVRGKEGLFKREGEFGLHLQHMKRYTDWSISMHQKCEDLARQVFKGKNLVLQVILQDVPKWRIFTPKKKLYRDMKQKIIKQKQAAFDQEIAQLKAKGQIESIKTLLKTRKNRISLTSEEKEQMREAVVSMDPVIRDNAWLRSDNGSHGKITNCEILTIVNN